MILLGYIIWLMLAVWIGRVVARCIKRSRRTQLAPGWGAGVLVALLPYWDVILGLPATIDACANRAGLHVHREIQFPLTSVHLVDEGGPTDVCSACQKMLVRGLAKEAQFDVAPVGGRIGSGSLVTKGGPTRYWISTTQDPACAAYLKWSGTLEDRRRYWEGQGSVFRGDECIAAQSITKLTADYRASLSITSEQHGVATLHIREVRLTRVAGDETVASLALVRQYPWTQRRFYFGLPPVPNCPYPSLHDPVTQQRLGKDFSYIALFNQLDKGRDYQGAVR